jgi:sporulation protein YlmC with PRC-barrel domain
MNAKQILVMGLSIGAFSMAPAVIAAEGTYAEKEMKSGSQQESSETSTFQQKEAVESTRPQTRENTQTKAQEARTLKASEVIGYSVKNAEGQELGAIEDLVLDPEHGRIGYAVLSFGGFLGMGDKLFAIPWEAMKPIPAQETFRLDIAKEKLEKAPGFNKDNWPDMANREWGLVVHKYYNLDPYWQE